MQPRRLAAVTAAVIGAVLVSISAVGSAGAATTTPHVIPPGAAPGGATYGQWSARWWTWALEQDRPSSPAVDGSAGTPSNPEPVDCTLGQSGGVWFLAGITFLQGYTSAYRSCAVPAGRFLFFPVIDAWADNLSCPGTPPGTASGADLAAAVRAQIDSIVPGSTSVTVDGASVGGLAGSGTAYRATAAGFTYSLPGDSPIGPAFCGTAFVAGTSPPPPGAYADGVYIMLAPLAPGAHSIHFAAQAAGVVEDVTYVLRVTAGG